MPPQADEASSHPTPDRGQLILVTGLLIAVAMIALILLLNTAIYTENLASRGADQSPREAIEYYHTTADGIRGIVREENEIRQNVTAIQQGYDPSRDELVRDVSSGVETLGNYTARQYALGGTIAAIDDVTIHNGTGIHQLDDRQMTSNAGAANWTLASDARGTRNFSMVVSGDLRQTGDPSAEAYRITVSNGTHDWALYVYENVTTGEPDLSVKNGNEPSPSRVQCSKPSTLPMEIDITGGAINGTSCPAIEYAKNVSEPYDLEYTWGNRSRGTYGLTINSTSIGPVNPIGSANSPFQTPAVYSVSYTVVYETDSLKFRSHTNVTTGDQAR